VADVRAPEGQGQQQEWLALQAVGALRPRECTDALRSGAHPRDLVAQIAARAPSNRWLRDGERRLAQLGAVLLPWGSPGYPEPLAELADAPPVLAVRGDRDALIQTAVAIVGSRAASAYGLEVARRVAGELASAGVVIVSGLAFGIDAAAHEAALAAGGRTIAVQACGIDRVYPAAHRALAERIAKSGAVPTELALGTPPLRYFFPLRNRLISGLARAVVVVEARERSGSLVTARHAADQGIDVFAVPGPITVAHHVGTNRLLRDGAIPLLETDDVLSAARARAALALRSCARPARRVARRTGEQRRPRAPGRCRGIRARAAARRARARRRDRARPRRALARDPVTGRQ
jgi:DNA processing protein